MATAFANALAQFILENPEQRAALVTLRQQCFQRILDGGGEISSDLSGTLNGQTFTYTINKSADELFVELGEVLGGDPDNPMNTRSVSMDFRYLQP